MVKNVKDNVQQGSMGIIPTGIGGLDTIIGGGVAPGAFIMLVGEPGSGKTVLVQQMCFHWVNQQVGKERRKALYFSTISEPHEKLIAHISKFDFYDATQIPDQFEIISLQDAMSQSATKIAETIMASARQRKAGLVAIDGFRSLIAVAGSTNQAAILLSQLSAQLNFFGGTLIVTLEQDHESFAAGELLNTADLIIALNQQRHEAHTMRRIEVPKLRGAAQLDGWHSYEITSSGMAIYPRLEALIKSAGQPDTAVVPDQRLAFGSAEIDRLMHGGVPRGSITMLAGSPSTGKTLLALHYLSEGLSQGEAGLMLNFGETRQQLINRAMRFNLSITQSLQDGTLRLHNIAPVEMDPDKIAHLIMDEVAQYNIKRLVIDSIDELERTTQPQQRSHDYIAALISYARSVGVTMCVTKSVPRISGIELDIGTTAMSLLAENLLLLRYDEKNNRLNRSIVVLKMRDSQHDLSIREFTIEDDGIKVQGKA